MRFLPKRPDSTMALSGLRYTKSAAEKNREIKRLLIQEQFGFCAYSEQRLSSADKADVEHLNPAKKYADDYRNYYAVEVSVHRRKTQRDIKFQGSSFFESLFFQDENELWRRIRVNEGAFEEIHPGDHEARDLIQYLGMNDYDLYKDRSAHVARVVALISETGMEPITYLEKYPQEIHFPSALAAALGMETIPLPNASF